MVNSGRTPRTGSARTGSLCAGVACAALALWAPAAAAQRCQGLAATGMVFTSYTPFGSGVAATSTLTYTCDAGVTQAWIGISRPRTLRSGGNTMQFEIYQGPDLSAVWPDTPPVPVPVAANASVVALGFLPPQDAAAGGYADVLFVTLYSGPNRTRSDFALLRVTAAVAPTCTIGAGALAFGSYDPLGVNATSPLDAQAAFQVACTRDTAYTVGLGLGSWAAGTTRQMASGAERLQYELYSDAARTSVWSATATVGGTAPSTAAVTLTVYGRVPGGQAAAAGGYADTVQSTINF